jgi:hypothetical protein
MTPRNPQSLTDNLKKLIEVLETKNQGQVYVRVRVLLSDLKELTAQRRNPITREYSYPAELAVPVIITKIQKRVNTPEPITAHQCSESASMNADTPA